MSNRQARSLHRKDTARFWLMAIVALLGCIRFVPADARGFWGYSRLGAGDSEINNQRGSRGAYGRREKTGQSSIGVLRDVHEGDSAIRSEARRDVGLCALFLWLGLLREVA